MKIAILKVILWPRKTTLAPRVISFVPGKINIITGESATGKSSLSWIIDYCLGSDKCSIPVGLIREKTTWFGLHLQLAHTQMLVARRNPEDQQATSDLYWAEGIDLQVPTVVQKNARVDDLKNRLNQIAGLPSLDMDDSTAYGGRPSFRDLASFNFQPQHIVANPYTLFFKADTTEHREKLRIIFPLALGVIGADTIAKQRELKDAEREHDRQVAELQARVEAAKVWASEVESYYLQARALGLLPQSPAPAPHWSLDKYVLELQPVPQQVETMDLPDVAQGTGEASVVELSKVIDEEDRISREVGSMRRRLGNLDQLATSVTEYRTALTTSHDRILGVGWLSEALGSSHQCPVCAATHPKGNPQLVELCSLAEEVKQLTASAQEAPAKLENEVAVLREALRTQESALSKARQKRRFLETASAEQAAQRQKVRQIYLFVGRVQQALENVAASSDVGDLRRAVQALAARIAAMRSLLDPNLQRDKQRAALAVVSSKLSELARLLKLEHADVPILLSIRELTLQFSRLSGRSDLLWELGSGQNWVGYHVAALLALHELFVTVPANPVPTFLMFDQPSQVYFPEAWPSLDQIPNAKEPKAVSADIAGVRRIFEAMSSFMDDLGGEFQILVTEHAGAITWQNIPYVHVVGNWRKGHDEFLIPEAWLGSD